VTAFLLDANVLIALTSRTHVHAPRVEAWFRGVDRFAVCPIVQGALVRFLTRTGEAPGTISAVLRATAARRGYEFWPDDADYGALDLSRIRGHRQVTDAYLVALAAAHSGNLATLDEPLVQLYPGHSILIPGSERAAARDEQPPGR
jgi:toxin-antitoxin system PIN domain toxin